MSYWTEHNISVIKLRLTKFAETEAKKEVLKRLYSIAANLIAFIDDNFKPKDKKFPEYSANLHDATGVAIYDNGVIRKYLPTRRAMEPQMNEINEEEWGYEMLNNAISAGLTHFSKGLWLVLFSGSSYADQIERIGSPKERGMGFFTNLAERLGFNISGAFGVAIVGSSGPAGFYLPT